LFSGREKADGAVEVNRAFQAVYIATQEALVEAHKQAREADQKVLKVDPNAKSEDSLKVNKIALTFATTTTSEVGVGAKIVVLSAKYTRTKAEAKQATFTFTEDAIFTKNNKLKNKHEDDIDKFKLHLVQVIRAAQQIENTATLGLKEVGVEVAFTLKNKGEGGVEVPISLTPVTASAGGSRQKEAVHKIALTLVRAEKQIVKQQTASSVTDK
jgi:hypothetical protein